MIHYTDTMLDIVHYVRCFIYVVPQKLVRHLSFGYWFSFCWQIYCNFLFVASRSIYLSRILLLSLALWQYVVAKTEKKE
jgi:hypothetical protein